MADKVKLSLAKATPESLAALFKKLTGREPDMAKIRAGLAKARPRARAHAWDEEQHPRHWLKEKPKPDEPEPEDDQPPK